MQKSLLSLAECLISNKNAQCEVHNLKDYAEFNCKIELDINKNPNITVYKDRLWYKKLYESSDDCALALKRLMKKSNHVR